ncbi:MAG: hypothetical protein ACAI25_20950 [Planctomycetota bacterium]
MLYALVTVAIIAALAFAAFTAYRSRLGPPAPGSETLRSTICDVKASGALRLAGFGDDGEDVELPISAVVAVRMGAESWTEMSGQYRSRLLRLEWRKKPNGTKVVAYSKTDQTLEEVQLDPAALDGAKAGGPPVAALGSTFKVEEAGDAIRGEALALKTWVLYDDEKRRVLRVERIGEQPPRACLGRVIAADAIDVVKIGS